MGNGGAQGMRERLFEALVALRDADDRARGHMSSAFRVVSDFIDTKLRRPPNEHEDIRQRALIKVFRYVHQLSADTPGAAESWLRYVHRSCVADHHRKFDPLIKERVRTRADEDGPSLLDRLAAPEPERTEDDEALLAEVTDTVMERVEEWLTEHVTRASKRVGDRQRAQLAWLVNVLGRDLEPVREELCLEAKRDTLYKWVERGREQVLLPVIAAWEATADDPTVPRAIAEILEGARRADAGKPRPGRRAVSRADGDRSDGANDAGEDPDESGSR